MERMRAVDAAVAILRREGVSHLFGVPGAAINPFYDAVRRDGGLQHVLARHVEGAAHMADGYSRTAAGNIGVCVGTSGPAGTDMVTGLYAAAADSVPLLAITGQAPVARLHKEDFQAVDIAAIAAPVTKWAVTVREPGQVPGVFAQAFHLMRSGRPGPVLIDLPVDVQQAEIAFDIDTYEPLPVHRPAATRAQAEKVLDLLSAAERPIIVAGGGIVGADACAELVALAELLDVPVVPTLMGWGAIPDDHPLMAGMAGLQTSHRYGNATLLESDLVLGIGNRWANRHTGGLDVYRAGRTFVHVDIEPTQVGRVFAPDYGVVSDAGAFLREMLAAAGGRTHPDRSACAPAARARCSAAPTSTTCRSSRSGCTRSATGRSAPTPATSAPSGCLRSRPRSSCTSSGRGTGSTRGRPARWAGPPLPRSASASQTPRRSSWRSPVTTISSS
jgi:tartronate-semialdehyde synthase